MVTAALDVRFTTLRPTPARTWHLPPPGRSSHARTPEAVGQQPSEHERPAITLRGGEVSGRRHERREFIIAHSVRGDPKRCDADPPPTFVAELLDALRTAPTPIRLILDDVHELISAEALGSLESFIQKRPIGLQLILSSRLDPPVSLPRLRLAGRLGELRADRLRFSRSETAAAMLRRSGLRLTPEQVQVLHEKTGGWAAGLRLAAFAVANTPDLAGLLADFSDDEHPVADDLVEKILAELPDDTQEFLRVTSISDPIPTRLAIELSGREDAGNLLDKLEDETSLVMATGPLREGYRVQPLLRIYLLADLQRHGATQVAGLRDTAARCWAARGGRYGMVPPLITAVHGGQAAS
jgi:LuxR family maltose regulon positive regulatory protein